MTQKPIENWIAQTEDRAKLKSLMERAKERGEDRVYWAAFKRRCQLEGMNYNDPLHREFYATLAAYEELLSEKNSKKTPANYTRRKLKNKGVEQCLEEWALDTKATGGFKLLIENGLETLTGEYLVLRYPDRFSEKAKESARERLKRFGVEI